MSSPMPVTETAAHSHNIDVPTCPPGAGAPRGLRRRSGPDRPRQRPDGPQSVPVRASDGQRRVHLWRRHLRDVAGRAGDDPGADRGVPGLLARCGAPGAARVRAADRVRPVGLRRADLRSRVGYLRPRRVPRPRPPARRRRLQPWRGRRIDPSVLPCPCHVRGPDSRRWLGPPQRQAVPDRPLVRGLLRPGRDADRAVRMGAGGRPRHRLRLRRQLRERAVARSGCDGAVGQAAGRELRVGLRRRDDRQWSHAHPHVRPRRHLRRHADGHRRRRPDRGVGGGGGSGGWYPHGAR